jgi:hypothetical protein
MYLLLLVFGAVLSAAGVVLAASGMSLRDATVDTTVLTPGIVATVGGVLLIGLGAGLRTLQRIEQALAARTAARSFPLPDVKPVQAGDSSQDTARIPLSPDPGRLSANGAAAPGPGDAGQQAAEPAKEADSAKQEVTQADPQPVVKTGNGAAAIRTPPHLPTPARPAASSEQQKRRPAFDALWPKGPRPMRAVDPVPAQPSASAAPIEPEKKVEQTDSGARQSLAAGAPNAVSVLKSGLVNGMPYTLYSDGSIEAQLAEETLRFGSINELRNHIEQSA